MKAPVTEENDAMANITLTMLKFDGELLGLERSFRGEEFRLFHFVLVGTPERASERVSSRYAAPKARSYIVNGKARLG